VMAGIPGSEVRAESPAGVWPQHEATGKTHIPESPGMGL